MQHLAPPSAYLPERKTIIGCLGVKAATTICNNLKQRVCNVVSLSRDTSKGPVVLGLNVSIANTVWLYRWQCTHVTIAMPALVTVLEARLGLGVATATGEVALRAVRNSLCLTVT